MLQASGKTFLSRVHESGNDAGSLDVILGNVDLKSETRIRPHLELFVKILEMRSQVVR